MNMGVQISLRDPDFNLFGDIHRSGIAGTYGRSVFNLSRNLHTIFHSGYINLDPQEQYKSVPFSLHPHQHLLSLVFLMIAILTGVR